MPTINKNTISPRVTPNLSTSKASLASLAGAQRQPLKERLQMGADLGLNISPPFSLGAGLTLKERTLAANDAWIISSELRKIIAHQIAKEQNVKEVAWRQSTGVVDLKANLAGSVPLTGVGAGPSLTLDFGFEPQALLSYNYLRPGRVYRDGSVDRALDDHFVPFPTSVQQASALPKGHEVEISGLGKLKISGGLSLGQALGTSQVIKLGAKASVGASLTEAQEYALSVMSIDDRNQVRVTIRKVHDHQKEINANLKAGVLGVGSLPIPTLGQGRVAHVLENASKGQISSLIGNYGAVVAHADRGELDKESVLCCYDLDLTREHAQRAYYGLLNLNQAAAEEWALNEDSGIMSVKLSEKEDTARRRRSFKALNRELYIKESNTTQRDGMLTSTNGTQIFYEENIFSKKSGTSITGMREIRWEGINIKDSHGRLHTYYRLGYEQTNKVADQEYVDRYEALSQRLGITPTAEHKSQLIAMNSVRKIISSQDNIKTSTEFFFNEQGVANIQLASGAHGKEAFFAGNINQELPSSVISQAFGLFDSYDQENQSLVRYIFPESASMKLLVQTYENNLDRNFKNDYEVYKKAKKFGDFVDKFSKPDDTHTASEFFSLLGQEHDFDYTEILGALALLAERENLKVHNLSLSGGGVLIKNSVDEGEIYHPKKYINHFAAQDFTSTTDPLMTSYA